jgi:hypothetical protein
MYYKHTITKTICVVHKSNKSMLSFKSSQLTTFINPFKLRSKNNYSLQKQYMKQTNEMHGYIYIRR